jgi:flavin reductase (DIM6/NTAB) family NADH-FMN oxidoreductase RutF
MEHGEVRRLAKIEIDPIVEALEQMPYGLYIVGSRGPDNVNGMMADWVMQVSFEPRLILISLENTSTTLKNLKASGVFSVNLLKSDGSKLAARFCQPREAAKIQGRSEDASAQIFNKFEGVDYFDGELTGSPILSEALMYLECQVDEFFTAGDHTLATGRVLGGEVLNEGEPLTQQILGWSYAG